MLRRYSSFSFWYKPPWLEQLLRTRFLFLSVFFSAEISVQSQQQQNWNGVYKHQGPSIKYVHKFSEKLTFLNVDLFEKFYICTKWMNATELIVNFEQVFAQWSLPTVRTFKKHVYRSLYSVTLIAQNRI